MEIKEARMAAGLSQQKMSDITGIPKRTIENWDAGVNGCPEWEERLIVNDLERIGKTMEEKRYLVINQFGDDNSIEICESLEDANAEAESTWSAMCGADQKRHHVYVIDVTGKDVGWEDGEPVWEDFHSGGYEPGRFDSDTL